MGGQPPFALAGVAIIVVVSAIGLFASIGRYGFFGDELYFVSAGRRLAFGYADQGSALPAIARAMDMIAPGSLVAQRIPAVLLTLVALVISAQITRELGGSRTAQILVALAYAGSPFLLAQGIQLATNTIDTALWVLITWLVVRWVRTRQDVLLLLAGVVTAVDMQVKWLIPFFWIAVAIGALVFGPRDLLRRPALWAGGAIVVVTMIPTLVWQANRDWPQLRLSSAVAAEQASIGGRPMWVVTALICAGLMGGILLIYGIWLLLRWEVLRPYRFLGSVPLLLAVVFLATNGRGYYAAGVYAVIMAAGALGWTRKSSRIRIAITAVLVLASLVSTVTSLPLRPESDIAPARDDADAALNMTTYAKFGWRELAESVAEAYRSLPAEQRADAVIVADSYWQASALDVYGVENGLPAVYSPNRGFGYFGTPPDSATTVLWVGGSVDDVRPLFGAVTPIGRADAELGYPGVTRDVTIWRCDVPKTPWTLAWPGMLRM
ncbi:glycosyltransferase family 39 protein [Nocardia callitridis]|uniref:Glycosyltransferase family 39 protein n=1 Tax=Nocardia callitridis TaxID=648753 RepID=A0ABP9KB11_9NOCA